LYIGGQLIRCFDGFRRLSRRAAADFNLPLSITEEERLLANRVLAALGGPPAPSEVRGTISADGLPLLLLFLLTQERDCRIALLGDVEATFATLKRLIHLFGHAVYPMLSGEGQLSFQEMVKELSTDRAVLRPVVQYDAEGEPTLILPTGTGSSLHTKAAEGPFTLLIRSANASGPAPVGPVDGSLHPTILLLG
jgi:hypothetical protein